MGERASRRRVGLRDALVPLVVGWLPIVGAVLPPLAWSSSHRRLAHLEWVGGPLRGGAGWAITTALSPAI